MTVCLKKTKDGRPSVSFLRADGSSATGRWRALPPGETLELLWSEQSC